MEAASHRRTEANARLKYTFFNETGRAATPVQCVDEEGLIERSSGNPLRIAVWTGDAVLTQKAYGFIPEPYSVTIDGVKQDGTFLGAAGQVQWAFKQETPKDGPVVWRPRLLLSREGSPNGNVLRDGEVAGYVTARFE